MTVDLTKSEILEIFAQQQDAPVIDLVLKRTFLPKDREGAIRTVAEDLYDLVQRIEALLGPKHDISQRLNNIIDRIERS